MKLLAFDTSKNKCSVALTYEDSNIFYEESSKDFMHSEELIPMIIDLLSKHSFKLEDIEALACTIGPGSFTGIRVGVAAARGIKKVFPDLKLLGISTLELLAYDVIKKEKNIFQNISTLIHAYKDEFYLQRFNNKIEPINEIISINVETLKAEIQREDLIISDSKIDNITNIYHLSHINAILLLEYSKKLLYTDTCRTKISPLYVKDPKITLSKK